MKKILLVLSLIGLTALSATEANAATWWYNGTLYGNVCRSGNYYTIYNVQFGQPVGSSCPVRDNYGNILMYGYVTNE